MGNGIILIKKAKIFIQELKRIDFFYRIIHLQLALPQLLLEYNV